MWSCLRFFFSSRRRHTRWPRDWSSDVCSSDLSASTWRPRSRTATPIAVWQSRRWRAASVSISCRWPGNASIWRFAAATTSSRPCRPFSPSLARPTSRKRRRPSAATTSARSARSSLQDECARGEWAPRRSPLLTLRRAAVCLARATDCAAAWDLLFPLERGLALFGEGLHRFGIVFAFDRARLGRFDGGFVQGTSPAQLAHDQLGAGDGKRGILRQLPRKAPALVEGAALGDPIDQAHGQGLLRIHAGGGEEQALGLGEAHDVEEIAGFLHPVDDAEARGRDRKEGAAMGNAKIVGNRQSQAAAHAEAVDDGNRGLRQFQDGVVGL